MRCLRSSNARITARAISIWPGRCSYSGCACAIRPSGPKISCMRLELTELQQRINWLYLVVVVEFDDNIEESLFFIGRKVAITIFVDKLEAARLVQLVDAFLPQSLVK